MEDDKLRKIISQNIRMYRAKYDYSQTTLADFANITQTQLSKLERGDVMPKISTLTKLAKIFNISVDDLLKPHF